MCQIGKEVRKISPIIAYRVFIKKGLRIPANGIPVETYGSLHMQISRRYALGEVEKADKKPTTFRIRSIWNTHGFWAYKTFNQAHHFFTESGAVFNDLVLCKVLLMGDISEHKKGYRAEYMVILKEYKTRR